MVRKAPGPFLSKSNDLVLVSMFMILTLLFIAAAEDPRADPPDWYEISYYMPQFEGDDNDTTPKVRTEIEIESTSGQTAEGSTTAVDIEVDHEGIIGLIVQLEWTDDIGDNDELGLSMSNGTDELDSSQGTSGQLRLELSSDVEGELMGEYTITVSALDCPGMVGPIPVDRDNGNSWSLTVTMVVME
jgi:hypothetical protein